MKGKPCQKKHPLSGAPRELVRFGRSLERAGLLLERTRKNHVIVLTSTGDHVGTLGTNRVSPLILKRCRRQIEQAIGRPLAA
jgi:hypothetical protein